MNKQQRVRNNNNIVNIMLTPLLTILKQPLTKHENFGNAEIWNILNIDDDTIDTKEGLFDGWAMKRDVSTS